MSARPCSERSGITCAHSIAPHHIVSGMWSFGARAGRGHTYWHSGPSHAESVAVSTMSGHREYDIIWRCFIHRRCMNRLQMIPSSITISGEPTSDSIEEHHVHLPSMSRMHHSRAISITPVTSLNKCNSDRSVHACMKDLGRTPSFGTILYQYECDTR